MVEPRVTVLMPVYNAQRFLREAINSILGQSFKPFEFLIIDDGSTDRSVEIVESFEDPRIRLVKNPHNMGITATLNKGIALASCELIARMDADDISHPQRLQKQFGYMKRNPRTGLLSSWARVVSEDHRFLRLERYESKFYFYNLTFECCIYHPTIMFRRSAAEQVGMYSLPYSEDYDFFWKMSRHFPIANLPEPLLDYRISSTSLNTVLKKNEYDTYSEQNVLRNLRYYLGEDLQMPAATLECLRHNFRPLLSEYRLGDALDVLAMLDAVTKKIIHTDNVNRDVASIRRAWYYKRRFILSELARALPWSKGVKLLLRQGAWGILWQLAKSRMKGHLTEALKIFSHNSSAAKFENFSSQVVKNS